MCNSIPTDTKHTRHMEYHTTFYSHGRSQILIRDGLTMIHRKVAYVISHLSFKFRSQLISCEMSHSGRKC